MKKYRVRERVPEDVHAALAEHPELVRELLHARGITDAAEATKFLQPDFERDSHDPFLLPQMEQAVERVRAAIQNRELVCVWSDYDCDGIPGGVMLSQFLRDIGGEIVHHIPHRHEDGYGLNNESLRELAGRGVKLVITVDLGTTDHEQVALASELGMDVIVTDHHLPHATLPPALAVLNPHRTDSAYPFRELCGAGVAWKLVQAILQKSRLDGQLFDYAEGREKWLLDLVGLATLADMVPLLGENRMLASYGLLVMRKNRRPGFASLLSLLRIQPRTLTEDDVSFMVAPRINAASRMGSPETAALLLAAREKEEADARARDLQTLNDERKGAVAATAKEARRRLKENSALSDAPVIAMGNPKWRPGILGLVANSLMESEGKPVFLWGREGGETLKGSCRSPGANVVDLMTGAKDIFYGFGGHELSGGFSLKEEVAHELSPRLSEAFKALPGAAKEKETYLDKELSLEDARGALRHLERLSPFGLGNQKPLFLFSGVSISRVKTFGKQNNHLGVDFSKGSERISGVSFFSTPESFQKSIQEGARADVVGHLERDWGGRPRLRVIDML